MKSNGCVLLLNIVHKNLYEITELLLTPFSPFGIKMPKTSGNVFLGHLGGSVFNNFPRLHSVAEVVP